MSSVAILVFVAVVLCGTTCSGQGTIDCEACSSNCKYYDEDCLEYKLGEQADASLQKILKMQKKSLNHLKGKSMWRKMTNDSLK